MQWLAAFVIGAMLGTIYLVLAILYFRVVAPNAPKIVNIILLGFMVLMTSLALLFLSKATLLLLGIYSHEHLNAAEAGMSIDAWAAVWVCNKIVKGRSKK